MYGPRRLHRNAGNVRRGLEGRDVRSLLDIPRILIHRGVRLGMNNNGDIIPQGISHLLFLPGF